MNDTVLADLKAQHGEMLEAIKTVVSLDSPSLEAELVNEVGRYFAGRFEELGAKVELVKAEGVGYHVKATYGDEHVPPILLVGHMDTVWGRGETEKRPFRVEDGKAFGPGIYDMKTGLVQGLFAAKYLSEHGIPLKRPLVFFYNSDEEIQSRTSRPFIEELARQSRCAFILEPSVAGDLVTARKGSGRMFLKTKGKSAHAGSGHHLGINAICEMARHILEFEALTDYSKGTTVNVGTISGGTKANVVPSEAVIEMSCRIASLDEQKRVTDAIMNAKALLPGASVEAWGTFERPLFTRTPEIEALFQLAKDQGAKLGLKPFDQAMVGSASDGNFTANLGVPTLDGMGGIGGGAHALDEWIDIEAIPERTALLVKLLSEI